jgi:undecaprenyl-diphosphatase
MTGFQNLIQQDRALFIFLNGLGNERWDSIWLLITNQFVWIPLYIFFLILMYKKLGQKKFLYFLLLIILLITFSDQITNFVKHTVERTRPNNNSGLKDFIRIILHPTGFGFYSGHASTSMAVTTFMYLLLKNHFQYALLFFIWPILFAYSRIYVGVHYPSDIVVGLTIGFALGFSFYKTGFYFLKPEIGQ